MRAYTLSIFATCRYEIRHLLRVGADLMRSRIFLADKCTQLGSIVVPVGALLDRAVAATLSAGIATWAGGGALRRFP